MNFNEYKSQLESDHEFRERVGNCPMCNNNVRDRKITLYQELIWALYGVYRWCGQNQRHEFDIRDIKKLIGKDEYARFGDLVRCSGGIIYRAIDTVGKKRRGYYGINMERARDFFHGNRQIPMQTLLNQVTNTRMEVKYAYIHELPRLRDLLREDGTYDHMIDLPGDSHSLST